MTDADYTVLRYKDLKHAMVMAVSAATVEDAVMTIDFPASCLFAGDTKTLRARVTVETAPRGRSAAAIEKAAKDGAPSADPRDPRWGPFAQSREGA